jgi:acyl-coenzyme A synthetase/AMP-(fatty) acid ligase
LVCGYIRLRCEAQLNTHAAVAGAVIVAERLLRHTSSTAYVVAAGETASAEMRRYLRERLPIQFVPSRVKFVAGLACTASGKVDRAATCRASANYASKGAGR